MVAQDKAAAQKQAAGKSRREILRNNSHAGPSAHEGAAAQEQTLAQEHTSSEEQAAAEEQVVTQEQAVEAEKAVAIAAVLGSGFTAGRSSGAETEACELQRWAGWVTHRS